METSSKERKPETLSQTEYKATDTQPETDWFGWSALVCTIAAIVIGVIPIIGNYFRLALGILGLGLAVGGIFENRRKGLSSKIAPIAVGLNIAVLIWVCISLTIIGGVLMELVSNL